ncbi:glycoside hydrolase family 16 protein [Streptomyces monashensis]|uniref:Laminarinase n=1 Tax=Streptomyces monashensis TaxID=1678012 RepID=A0A1S2PDY8_9ACTN|nr:glycoside hydrolase family 16 protein [Streptomyces monashensis]OIJ91816.1 laminarinase [Streptomyces monashensis]
MPTALLSPGRLIVAASAALSLLLLGQPQAHAASWGTPQTINSWNAVNGRWTANNELETYTPNCVWYEGSTLVIKTYKSGSTYYSGRVESKALYGYGTYSFTANMPNGQGLLPAVWAAYLNPWLPEFDAAEIVGQNPNTVYQTFHDPNNTQTQFSKTNSAGWTNTSHTYSFTWWPDHIDFAVDGTVTGTKWYTTAPGVGMHFIVNTAVGGDWPGNPNDSTWATADGARYLKASSITYTPYYP